MVKESGYSTTKKNDVPVQITGKPCKGGHPKKVKLNPPKQGILKDTVMSFRGIFWNLRGLVNDKTLNML